MVCFIFTLYEEVCEEVESIVEFFPIFDKGNIF